MCGHRTTRYSTTSLDRDLRASDADRERVADVLRDNAGEGRLDPDELEQRLEVAYSAKTLGDLDGVTSDLPASRRSYERARAPHWHPIVLLLAVVLAVSVIAGHPAVWIAFPLFFWVWRPLMRPRWRV